MTMKDRLVAQLWAGKDPFAGFPADAYPMDLQGWNSNHPFLTGSLEELRPSLVLEVGVWKGGSVITMARTLQALGLDAAVIAVDTWLGAWDHWLNPGFFADLAFENGYPRLFHRFMANVVHLGLTDYVVPLPLDSGNAIEVVKAKGLRPDFIHLDGAHDYESVSRDLKVWWPQLKPGGILVADDYTDDGRWPDVRRAVDDFYQPRGLTIDMHGSKGRLRKRPTGSS